MSKLKALRMKIATVLIYFFTFKVFAEIPGVPHKLRRHFKSSHKFKETSFTYNGSLLKMRKAPDSDRIVLIYNIPAKEQEKELIKNLISPILGKNYSFKIFNKNNNVSEYQVFYKKRIIENAYVKFFAAENNHLAMGINVPYNNLSPIRFSGFNKKNFPLILLGGMLVEKNKVNQIVSFPKESGFAKKLVKTIKPQKSLTGEIEKIKIPEGSFPDQIQSDSDGKIWFTQPLDGLITSFDPSTDSWFHKKVGEGPDGIYIDSDDRIWFGEYNDNHLGFYDIGSNDYQRFKIPYKDSAPAIPYHGNSDFVWLTDHRNNKVLSFH